MENDNRVTNLHSLIIHVPDEGDPSYTLCGRLIDNWWSEEGDINWIAKRRECKMCMRKLRELKDEL